MNKISVVIPYKGRMSHLKNSLERLTAQTLPQSRYEIIVGSLDDYELTLNVQREYPGVRIVSSPSYRWNPSLARNIGLREARGDLLVLVDVDILVREDFLAKHLSAASSQKMTVGSVRDYDENKDIADVGRCLNQDVRWTIDLDDAPLKWALAWTGNVSFPRSYIEQGILFDESLTGWGGEDIDFAYRLWRAGARIVFDDSVEGTHVAHFRDVRKNRDDERQNFYRFLRKVEDPLVEFVVRFGDLEANRVFERLYDQRMNEYCIVFEEGIGSRILIGQKKTDAEGVSGQVLYISGLALPFPNSYFDEVVVKPMAFPEELERLILAESRRVKR